jgi:PAS domain S-box-containing protein
MSPAKPALDKPPRLVLRFAIYSALALLLAGLAIYWFVRHETQESAERERIARAVRIATRAGAEIQPSDLRGPVLPERAAELDRGFADESSGDLVLVRLWTTNGVLAYSSEHRLIGSRSSEPAKLEAALGGGTLREVVNTADEQSRISRKTLEAFVPLLRDGRPIGALEINFDYAPVASYVRSTMTPIAIALALALLLLYATLLPILRQVTRTLDVRARRMSEHADELRRALVEREQVEEKLSAAEHGYRNLIEQLPLVTYIDHLDESSSSIYISPQAEALLGYPPVAWLSDPEFFPKVLHPADREHVLAKHAEAYANEESFSSEYRLLARDGRVVWVQDHVMIARDPAGRPLHAQGFMLDVTERKQAEENLRLQNQELAALHETALGLIERLDADSLLETILVRACELAGTPHAYLYLVDGDELEVRLARGRFNEGIGYRLPRGEGLAGRVWETGEPLAVEDYSTWSGRRTDFDDKPLHAVVGVPLRSGGKVVGVLGLARDEVARPFTVPEVTFLRRISHLASVALENARLYSALAESEEHFRALVANVPGAIFRCAFDADWTMEFLSDAIEEIAGYPASDFIHNRVRSYASIVHPDDADMLTEAVGDGTPYSVEYRVVRSDDTVRWVLERGQGVRDAAGNAWLAGAIFDVTERKAAEQERLQLAAIVESSEDAIIGTSLDDIVLSWNAGAERIYGYTAEEMIGKPISVTVPADREHERPRWLEEINAGKSVENCDSVRLRKNGEPVDVSVTLSPIRDASGAIVAASTIARDITERKRSEQALRQKTAFVELLHSVAAAANESATLDEALQICIDRVCAHTDWPVGHVYLVADDSPEELVPTTLWHLADPEQFEVFRRITEAKRFPIGMGLPGRVLASRAPHWIMDVTADSNFPRATQAEEIGVRSAFAFPVLVGKDVAAVLEFFSPEAVEPDEQLLRVMAHVGAQLGRVIERKRAEEALRDSEKHYRSVIETANDAFVSIDGDGLVTDWNERAEETFGWSREEVLGRSLLETIIPEADRKGRRKGMKHFLATGESPALSNAVEVEALHRDGHEFPVEVTLWSVQVGQDVHHNAFLRDVSERKRAESERERLLTAAQEARNELAAQNERLLELDRLKDEFIALVSHELRTPLTSIRGYTELLIDETAGKLTDDQRQFLAVVDRNSNRLLNLVGDLLFLAQIDAGKLVLDVGALDLASLASEAVETARPTAEDKGVTLTLATGPVPLLAGDRSRIGQLLDNLVSNAVKFTGSGGRVDVRVRSLKKRAVLEVRDSGIGIPAAEQQFLFQRFFRTSTATQQAIQGTGLGLAISKAIVEAHGGEISVESREGMGTTFRVTLPLHQPASQPRSEAMAL